jgi:hypothetical protein
VQTTLDTMKRNIVIILLAACTSTTPGARPHDMSAAQHEREADQEASAANREAAAYNPRARAVVEGCGPNDKVCWLSKRNPTAKHRDLAEQHRRAAADHRAASGALRQAEDKACTGVDADDRDISPFERTEDIAGIEPLVERHGGGRTPVRDVTAGVRVLFQPVPGLTVELLQREIDCHLARNAVLGHDLPEMPDCPLVPKGADARVRAAEKGLVVEVRSDDSSSAAEIVARAQRLKSH